MPLRIPLIGTAFTRREPPGRASPVPCQTFGACSPPYPGGVLHPSGSSDAVCCLRRDMTGSADPSLSGAYVSGLQGSLHAGPAPLLPTREPYSPRRAFDAPLGRRDLARRLEPATWLSGDYQRGTLTRWLDTACKPDFELPAPRVADPSRVRTHHARHSKGVRRECAHYVGRAHARSRRGAVRAADALGLVAAGRAAE